jgi:hypothetical protein
MGGLAIVRAITAWLLVSAESNFLRVDAARAMRIDWLLDSLSAPRTPVSPLVHARFTNLDF